MSGEMLQLSSPKGREMIILKTQLDSQRKSTPNSKDREGTVLREV